MSYASGRHFLQIPGPTNVPDRVLRAMAQPTMDHRGPEFGVLGREVLAELKPIFKTRNPVIIYPASGTGAWEAALVNTLSPGDQVLMCETGWFASLWREMALKLGLAARDSFRPIGATAPIRPRSRIASSRIASTRSKPSASCTTRRRRVSSAASARCARRSIARAIRRCCSSTRSRRSARSTTAWTSGAST